MQCFGLHAAVRCGVAKRLALEQLCRYTTRPALANEGLWFHGMLPPTMTALRLAIRRPDGQLGSTRASGDQTEQSFDPALLRTSASWRYRELVVPATSRYPWPFGLGA